MRLRGPTCNVGGCVRMQVRCALFGELPVDLIVEVKGKDGLLVSID